jgi:uncharacterized membrane protein
MESLCRRCAANASSNDEASSAEPGVPEHVGLNIQTIAELFAKTERKVGRHQLAIERITNNFGRPATNYALALAVTAWILWNTLAPRFGLGRVDPPPFLWLQGVACVSSLLMMVTVLTTQNRVAKLAQQRAELDLQVNLIAEEKIAKLISLVEELRRDLPSVQNRTDSLAEAMTEAVNVHAIADELEAIQGQDRNAPRATPPTKE